MPLERGGRWPEKCEMLMMKEWGYPTSTSIGHIGYISHSMPVDANSTALPLLLLSWPRIMEMVSSAVPTLEQSRAAMGQG